MAVSQYDVLEVAARTEFNGVEDIVNVFQFEYQSVPGLTDEQGIEDVLEFIEAIYDIFIGAQTILQLYRDLRVTNKTQEIVYGTFTWPTLIDGEDIAKAQAPGTCVLSNFSTGVARVAPRKYWGVFCADNMDADGTWSSAVLATFATVNSLMLLPYVATNGTWQYGYESPKVGSFVAPVSAVVTDIPAYQRRRKQGKGS